MDRMMDWGMSPRKRIASGDKDALDVGDFKVDHLDSHAAGNKPYNKGNALLADGQRGAKPPMGGNQANADHGPHGTHE